MTNTVEKKKNVHKSNENVSSLKSLEVWGGKSDCNGGEETERKIKESDVSRKETKSNVHLLE